MVLANAASVFRTSSASFAVSTAFAPRPSAAMPASHRFIDRPSCQAPSEMQEYMRVPLLAAPRAA